MATVEPIDGVYELGVLCKRNHDYNGTGKTVRNRHNQCILCQREHQKRYRTTPKRKAAIEKAQKRFHEANPDYQKTYAEAWRKRNPEYRREYMRNYRERKKVGT